MVNELYNILAAMELMEVSRDMEGLEKDDAIV